MTYFEYDRYMNYEESRYNGFGIRGKIPDFNKVFASFIGAAQTFGRFCNEPFPNVSCDVLGISGLNLGQGGAGPEERLFYKSLNDINRSKFCVVQIMSGRSCSNSLLKIKDGQNSRLTLNGNEIVVPDFWDFALSLNNEDFIELLIKDTIKNYINSYKTLLSLIKVPKILLLISTSDLPDTISPKIRKYDSFIGNFPHLITKRTVKVLKKYSNHYVEVISNSGLPQKLEQPDTKEYHKTVNMYNREGFKPTLYNTYYPSPEMHLEISNELVKIAKKII